MGKKNKSGKRSGRCSSRSPSRKRRHKHRTHSRKTRSNTPSESESYSDHSSSSSSTKLPASKRENRKRVNTRERRTSSTSGKRHKIDKDVDDCNPGTSDDCFQGTRTEQHFEAHYKRNVQDSINVRINSETKKSRHLKKTSYMVPSGINAVSEMEHVHRVTHSNRVTHTQKSNPDLLHNIEHVSQDRNQKADSVCAAERTNACMLSFAGHDSRDNPGSHLVSRAPSTGTSSLNHHNLQIIATSNVGNALISPASLTRDQRRLIQDKTCQDIALDQTSTAVVRQNRLQMPNRCNMEQTDSQMQQMSTHVPPMNIEAHQLQGSKICCPGKAVDGAMEKLCWSKSGDLGQKHRGQPNIDHTCSKASCTGSDTGTSPAGLSGWQRPHVHGTNYQLIGWNEPSTAFNHDQLPNSYVIQHLDGSMTHVSKVPVRQVDDSHLEARGQRHSTKAINRTGKEVSSSEPAVCQKRDGQPNSDEQNCSEASCTAKSCGSGTGTLHANLGRQKITCVSNRTSGVRESGDSSKAMVLGNDLQLPDAYIIQHPDGRITQISKIPPKQVNYKEKKCCQSKANASTEENAFTFTTTHLDHKMNVEQNRDDHICNEVCSKSQSPFSQTKVVEDEALLSEGNTAALPNDSTISRREEHHESRTKHVQHNSELQAIRTSDDHVDPNDVSRTSKSENSTEYICAKGAVPGLSQMTAEYKTCKVDERVPQIQSIELNPIRRLFFAHENNKINHHKFNRLIKDTHMRKIGVPGNGNTLISCLLITLSEIGRSITRENFCKPILSDLGKNINEYEQLLRNGVTLETFKDICEAYCRGRPLEKENIHALYQACANAYAVNLNLIYIDSVVRKHVLKAYDCTRCTSTDNIFLFFSWRGNKESKMYPHYDCYVKDDYYEKNLQLINFQMLNRDVTQ